MSDPVLRRPLAVVGPTASGKTALALALARRCAAAGTPTELVSVDSMAVYAGMQVGTAAPGPDERGDVPVHLVGVVDPAEECSLAEFARLADDALAGVRARGAAEVLVGGTGLYVRALVDGLAPPGRYPEVVASLEAEPDTVALHARLVELDPVAAARMEPTNRRRVLRALEVTLGSGRPFSSFGPGLEAYPEVPTVQVGLSVPRHDLDRRVRERLARQLDDGFLDEVAALLDRPGGWSRTASQALGYRELAEHLRGERSLADAVELTVRRTRQFAVRQERWFRRDPRIVWLPADAPVDDLVDAALTATAAQPGDRDDAVRN